MTDLLLVLTTFPDAAHARQAAAALVEERLAACASLVPGIESIYRWQGAVETAAEVLLLIKTRAGLYDRLAGRLRGLHPYEVPEILALRPEHASPAYRQWLLAETGPSNGEPGKLGA
ncbi:MAG TPA: divalent-cation tolerance protein CutA [Prosthecobacter sp.]|nr:divalent-cation tolerance protein CutA [Prosthecobacter sp.]HRK16997.1 divalent-cation tolerance protein CutA [Prosthecobacter sp.]